MNLTEIIIPLDETKKLKSLSFESSSSRATTTIIAVAKKEKMSGINDVNSDSERTIIGIYNLQGVSVKNPTSGLYIVRYSDGSSQKILIK